MTLETRCVSLLDGQLILAGVCLFDPLMTIGTPRTLTGCQLCRGKLRGSGGYWLELEVFRERLSMLDVRKIDAEIAAEQSVEPVAPFLEVVEARGA